VYFFKVRRGLPQRIGSKERQVREPALVRNLLRVLSDVGPRNLIVFLPSVRLYASQRNVLGKDLL